MQIEKFDLEIKPANTISNPIAFNIVTKMVLKIDQLKFEVSLSKSAVMKMEDPKLNTGDPEKLSLVYFDKLFTRKEFYSVNETYLGGNRNTLLEKGIPVYYFFDIKITSGVKVLYNGPMFNGQQFYNLLQKEFNEKDFVDRAFMRMKSINDSRDIKNKSLWIDIVIKHILFDALKHQVSYDYKSVINKLLTIRGHQEYNRIQLFFPLNVRELLSVTFGISFELDKTPDKMFFNSKYKLTNKDPVPEHLKVNLITPSFSKEMYFPYQQFMSVEEIVNLLNGMKE